MRKILVLSFYFTPDLCAGSFRNSSLVKELSRQLGENGEIHVITSQPNRYKTFKGTASEHEKFGNLTIDRVELPVHKSGFADQIISFVTFYRNALKLVSGNHYDLVYASSSRLFTAYLGRRIATRMKAPLYLDIRDIFVETMEDVLSKKKPLKWVLLPLVKKFIEAPTFRNAEHINLVSEGFQEYFASFNKPDYSYYSNGIDEEFLNLRQNPNLSPNPRIITYAGNIGEGQGLEKIIPEVARLTGAGFLFQVIGDGGTRPLLEDKIREYNLDNVVVIDPLKRDALIDIYKNSHYLFLHLNNYKAFERVLPSKIFEYAAFDMPIIAGVPGYSRRFIEENVANSFVFDPCDYAAVANWLMSHTYRLEERPKFVNRFSRESINSELAQSILSIIYPTQDQKSRFKDRISGEQFDGICKNSVAKL